MERLPEVDKRLYERARELVEFTTSAVGGRSPVFLPPTHAQLAAEFPRGKIYRHFTEVDPEDCETVTVATSDERDHQLAILAVALGLRDNPLSH